MAVCTPTHESLCSCSGTMSVGCVLSLWCSVKKQKKASVSDDSSDDDSTAKSKAKKTKKVKAEPVEAKDKGVDKKDKAADKKAKPSAAGRGGDGKKGKAAAPVLPKRTSVLVSACSVNISWC